MNNLIYKNTWLARHSFRISTKHAHYCTFDFVFEKTKSNIQ